MKVSINTVTGLLVESSSTSSAETLLENAIGAGIPASDVEVRDVDETEHSRLIAARDAANTTPAQAVARFTAEIQKHLDEFAKTRGYDGILSACTYATSLVQKFKSEGQYCVEARDTTWSKSYEIMAAVQSGARPMPTLDEVMAELPLLAWPA